MALEKAKRKQAAAVEKVKAKDRKVQEEQAREDRRKQKLIDQYDTGGRKGGKKKKKTVEATPIEDAVKALNFAKIEEVRAPTRAGDGGGRLCVCVSVPYVEWRLQPATIIKVCVCVSVCVGWGAGGYIFAFCSLSVNHPMHSFFFRLGFFYHETLSSP